MAFDDKDFGVIFPIRTGPSIGTSGERKMLDVLGGADSFRTRIQVNPDGSTTMLRTKNGMPQFTTTKVAVVTPDEFWWWHGRYDSVGGWIDRLGSAIPSAVSSGWNTYPTGEGWVFDYTMHKSTKPETDPKPSDKWGKTIIFGGSHRCVVHDTSYVFTVLGWPYRAPDGSLWAMKLVQKSTTLIGVTAQCFPQAGAPAAVEITTFAVPEHSGLLFVNFSPDGSKATAQLRSASLSDTLGNPLAWAVEITLSGGAAVSVDPTTPGGDVTFTNVIPPSATTAELPLTKEEPEEGMSGVMWVCAPEAPHFTYSESFEDLGTYQVVPGYPQSTVECRYRITHITDEPYVTRELTLAETASLGLFDVGFLKRTVAFAYAPTGERIELMAKRSISVEHVVTDEFRNYPYGIGVEYQQKQGGTWVTTTGWPVVGTTPPASETARPLSVSHHGTYSKIFKLSIFGVGTYSITAEARYTGGIISYSGTTYTANYGATPGDGSVDSSSLTRVGNGWIGSTNIAKTAELVVSLPTAVFIKSFQMVGGYQTNVSISAYVHPAAGAEYSIANRPAFPVQLSVNPVTGEFIPTTRFYF